MAFCWCLGGMGGLDATCPVTFTPPHVSSAAMSSGTVAKQAEQAKRASPIPPGSRTLA